MQLGLPTKFSSWLQAPDQVLQRVRRLGSEAAIHWNFAEKTHVAEPDCILLSRYPTFLPARLRKHVGNNNTIDWSTLLQNIAAAKLPQLLLFQSDLNQKVESISPKDAHIDHVEKILDQYREK